MIGLGEVLNGKATISALHQRFIRQQSVQLRFALENRPVISTREKIAGQQRLLRQPVDVHFHQRQKQPLHRVLLQRYARRRHRAILQRFGKRFGPAQHLRFLHKKLFRDRIYSK